LPKLAHQANLPVLETLNGQFLSAVESPLLLLLSPDQANAASTSLNLPLKIYESALGSDAPGESTEGDAVGKLVELAYNINTGEAERIAVEGAAKPSDDAHDSGRE
jgi:COP9 signalosome complex subunit 6